MKEAGPAPRGTPCRSGILGEVVVGPSIEELGRLGFVTGRPRQSRPRWSRIRRAMVADKRDELEPAVAVRPGDRTSTAKTFFRRSAQLETVPAASAAIAAGPPAAMPVQQFAAEGGDHDELLVALP